MSVAQPQNVTNKTTNNLILPPQTVKPDCYYNNTCGAPPSGGGGGNCGKIVEYENHNHGCRDESPGEWVQNSNSFEYWGTFKIPNAR
ncbi:MAG: hypothetical protein WBP64_18370 [Nitrososphaeraceae archaeon]